MDSPKSYRLQDIMPLDEMENILEQFCVASKLITIISDFRGVMVTKKNTSYYTPFCKKARLTGCPLGPVCERSDALGGLEAARQGKPYIYRCHMGLVEVAAPIIVNDMYLGAILMGQVKTDPDKMAKIPQVFKTEFGPDDTELKELFEQSFADASYIPYDQLIAFSTLMECTANLIAQTAVNQSISDQLNTSRIKHLEEMSEKATLEKNMASLELKNLRIRIHPHFLFNCLNSISGLAVIENASQTAEAINSLASTLRLTLKKQQDPMVPLREEMECVNGYLALQELLLKGRVEFSAHIDEHCLDAYIPLYTIQLIVENSFLHGFADVKSGGKFELDVRQIGSFMHINVNDNGVGIDDDTLHFFNFLSHDTRQKDTAASGLRSLIACLKYYFGDDARWKASRCSPTGTRFQIILPICYSNPKSNASELQAPHPFVDH